MSESSGFWTTNAAGSGDQQASYSQADFSDAYRILSACASFEGVAVNFLNELECTDGGFETVDVDTGGAMVDGKWFLNDASQSVTIPSAVGVGNTRIDRIVARADWANFNVSVYRIAGTDAASPTAPAVTQTSETTYDIKLCQVLVDTSGNVSVTDEREWAAPEVDDTTIEVAQSTGALQVKDGGIDADAITDNAVTDAKLATEYIYIKVFSAIQPWSTGDGKFKFTILDGRLNGATLADVEISCDTPSTSGAVTVQIARGRRATPSGAPSYNDMLSTAATIDVNEYTSIDATTAPVINASYDDIAYGDIIRIDIDGAGSGTKGLDVILKFTL